MPSKTGAYSYFYQNFELEDIDCESEGEVVRHNFCPSSYQDSTIDEAFRLVHGQNGATFKFQDNF